MGAAVSVIVLAVLNVGLWLTVRTSWARTKRWLLALLDLVGLVVTAFVIAIVEGPSAIPVWGWFIALAIGWSYVAFFFYLARIAQKWETPDDEKIRQFIHEQLGPPPMQDG